MALNVVFFVLFFGRVPGVVSGGISRLLLAIFDVFSMKDLVFPT